MPYIVGIRFKPAGRIYYFNPAGHDLKKGEWAIVETSRGIEAGQVVIPPQDVPQSQIVEPLKPVLRPAISLDLIRRQYYASQQAEALQICQERVQAHNLPMKLVGAEYSFDGSRLTFSFVAEGRIDFRELVKDLASLFKTRIELRQIGARDQAKEIGGYGICGKPICCASFLGDYPSASVKMAKEQDLPLNPAKITGLCGRLLCCLNYENEGYAATRQKLPKVGEPATTPQGKGIVTGLNLLKPAITVELEGGVSVELPPDQVQWSTKTPAPARSSPCTACPAQKASRRPRSGRKA